ncbi:ATP-dependent DNA helicase sgs1 [Globomyces sp. JEL0801]|nr:ATP-dependent DNA helicase sgs1 [Globomyces sp. JEL0801]
MKTNLQEQLKQLQSAKTQHHAPSSKKSRGFVPVVDQVPGSSMDFKEQQRSPKRSKLDQEYLWNDPDIHDSFSDLDDMDLEGFDSDVTVKLAQSPTTDNNQIQTIIQESPKRASCIEGKQSQFIPMSSPMVYSNNSSKNRISVSSSPIKSNTSNPYHMLSKSDLEDLIKITSDKLNTIKCKLDLLERTMNEGPNVDHSDMDLIEIQSSPVQSNPKTFQPFIASNVPIPNSRPTQHKPSGFHSTINSKYTPIVNVPNGGPNSQAQINNFFSRKSNLDHNDFDPLQDSQPKTQIFKKSSSSSTLMQSPSVTGKKKSFAFAPIDLSIEANTKAVLSKSFSVNSGGFPSSVSKPTLQLNNRVISSQQTPLKHLGGITDMSPSLKVYKDANEAAKPATQIYPWTNEVQKALRQIFRIEKTSIDCKISVCNTGNDDEKSSISVHITFLASKEYARSVIFNAYSFSVDVVQVLQMQGCLCFEQSFNRPNLRYEIRPKDKSIETSIVAFVKTHYPNQSGIIYCLSKKSCEDMANKLQKIGLKCAFYHAGLDKADRTRIQNEWAENKVLIIIATVAFGMGIDKPDVRFVVHHSLPQSLEGYYQETGRAGRDGNDSTCLLYYAYRDKISIDFMIDRGEGNAELKERQRNNLSRVIAYCENKLDCRRQLVLAYFGEKFDKAKCKGTCDNCQKNLKSVEVDISEHTKSIILLLKSLSRSKVTLNQLSDVYRGMNGKKILDSLWNELPEYGKGTKTNIFIVGQSLKRIDLERIFHHLISLNVIKEVYTNNSMGFVNGYVELGKEFHRYESGRHPLIFRFPVDQSSSTTKKVPTRISKPVNDSQPETYKVVKKSSKVKGQSESQSTKASVDPESVKLIKNACFEQMKQLRNSVTNDLTSNAMPSSVAEMVKIPDIDDEKMFKYGFKFLDVVKIFLGQLSKQRSSSEHFLSSKKSDISITSKKSISKLNKPTKKVTKIVSNKLPSMSL